MSKRIESFSFQVVPWSYSIPRSITAVGDPVYKELRITVVINGRTHSMAQVIFDPEPWESEFEHYVRIAVETFKETLKNEDSNSLSEHV